MAAVSALAQYLAVFEGGDDVFDAGPNPRVHPVRTPLLLAEQINVVAAMAVSQAIQVVFFTAGLFAFFLALGVIAIPDDVIVLWSAEESCSVGEPPCAGRWFGIHTPVPQTVVHVVLLVAVLSGLYFTVTSVDPHTSNWRTPAPCLLRTIG